MCLPNGSALVVCAKEPQQHIKAAQPNPLFCITVGDGISIRSQVSLDCWGTSYACTSLLAPLRFYLCARACRQTADAGAIRHWPTPSGKLPCSPERLLRSSKCLRSLICCRCFLQRAPICALLQGVWTRLAPAQKYAESSCRACTDAACWYVGPALRAEN